MEFSGIETFLDLPVKRYSSGMYVRLTFAVAAHLEPEILIVDEVLAVGDQAFQDRCLGKMNELTQSGRTVLFVRHNLQMLARLCGTIVWLEQGGVRATGAARPVLAQFNRASTSRARSAVVCLANREGRIQPALIQLNDGQVKFSKDGYTDLRGRFDYGSVGTNELDNLKKFSPPVMSEDNGALIREVKPPQR